jgi:hypothetical protein
MTVLFDPWNRPESKSSFRRGVAVKPLGSIPAAPANR